MKELWADFKAYHFARGRGKDDFLMRKYAHKSITPRQLRRLYARGHVPLQVQAFRMAASSRIALAPEVPSVTTPPNGLGYDGQEYHTRCPEIVAYVFDNAIVEVQSNHLLLTDEVERSNIVAVPDVNVERADRYLWHGRKLVKLHGSTHWTSVKPKRTIERGIALFGDGAANWFHWMIEFLPTAMLADTLPAEFSNYPLLVPEECKTIDSFRQSLEIFAGDREIVYLKYKEVCTVKHLVRIEPVAFGPFNMQPHQWVEPQDYYQNADLLQRYIQQLRTVLLPEPPAKTRRIFLMRADVRRPYNETALCDIARQFDFEFIRPETLTLREQAEVFQSAEIVVGASGAAWTNLIFSSDGGKGISWLPEHYSGFSSFSNLAKLTGRDLRFICSELEGKADSTKDLFTMGYTVDPEAFELLLRELLCVEGREARCQDEVQP